LGIGINSSFGGDFNSITQFVAPLPLLPLLTSVQRSVFANFVVSLCDDPDAMDRASSCLPCLDNLEYPEPLNFLDLLEPRPAVEIVQDEQAIQIARYFLVDSIERLELVPDAADACA